MVDASEGILVVSRLGGTVARQAIEEASSPSVAASIASSIGQSVAMMHGSHLVHGDLTTSNFMVLADHLATGSPPSMPSLPSTSPSSVAASDASAADGEARVAPIDLGLCSQSHAPEDKAVDLYVLRRALDSTHPGAGPLWEAVMAAYLQTGGKEAAAVLARYEEVQMRGRKRLAFG